MSVVTGFDLPRSLQVGAFVCDTDSDTDMVQDAMVLDAFTEIIDAN